MNKVLLLFLATASGAMAQSSFEVLPPDFNLFGKTLGEYSAESWKYNIPISTNQNPLFAPAGSLGDPVYFLRAVIPYEANATPIYTIPEDVYLCFSIVSVEADNIDTFPPLTVEQLRDAAAALMDTVTELRTTIDGISLTNLFAYRAKSPAFSISLSSADNFLSYSYGHSVTGLIDPIVIDGFWLVTKPLPVGLHSFSTGITFGPPYSFSSDSPFFIRVLPIPLPNRVGGLISLVEASNLPANRSRRSWQASSQRKIHFRTPI